MNVYQEFRNRKLGYTKVWEVPSSREGVPPYLVGEKEDGSRDCDCPGFMAHRHCRHTKDV